MEKIKILLIGDNCVDKYTYGIVARISPEAPVPVFNPTREIEKAGMAGNVKHNLEKFGLEVNYLFTDTSVKNRLIDEHSGQHIVRIDYDAKSNAVTMDDVVDNRLSEYDAIVISDYNKGTVTYELVEQLRAAFSGPIFLDTKKHNLKRFNGCFVKVNESERNNAISLPDPQWLITTLGKNGATYCGNSFASALVDVVDVCGAGDTFIAALVFWFVKTNQLDDAIRYANKAAAITVSHVGVYAPSEQEITNFSNHTTEFNC